MNKKTRIYKRNVLLLNFYKFWVNYISPANFSFFWNFGSMALVCLIIQIATGIFLAMHYKSDLNLAFLSVDYINRHVQYGWIIRFLHANGASIFFLVVYLHMIRSLFYGSFLYPRQMVWGTGVVIYILMIATAFFGYVLPWGQMSFWAATVITSLFTAIPIIGTDLVLWLWGGFSVDDATLNRFYSLHFFLPFVILALSIIHMMFLHEFGSNNVSGINFRQDGISMAPLYIIKDLVGINWVFLILCYLVCFLPLVLSHPDNFIVSNPLVTPNHIVPEWYFLPLYALLRSVPDKLLGIIVLAFALIGLLILPFIVGKWNVVRSFTFKPGFVILVTLFILNGLILGWVGGKPVNEPYFTIGQFSTLLYFILLISFGFYGLFEQLIVKSYVRLKKI